MAPDRRSELLSASGPRRANRRHDPAAGGVQLLVGRAVRAQRELLDAVTGEARMCVAVHQARNRAETAAVQLLHVALETRQLSHRADRCDASLLAEGECTFDRGDLAQRGA